jgi:hypothetical protein
MRKRGVLAKVQAIVIASCGLAACGLAVPDIKEVWDADMPPRVNPANGKPTVGVSGTAQIEFEIKRRIYCDLKSAVQAVNQIQVSEGRGPPKQPLPPDWGAQVSLSLQVDEAAALNPGVTFNQVLPNAIKAFGPANTVTTPQSFNLGFGATLSSTATRVDKFDPYWSIAFLMTPDTAGSACKKVNGEYVNDLFKQLGWTPASSSPFILESDLGIKEWLRGAMMVDYLLHSVGAPAAKGGQNPDTVSYEIKFVIVSNGSVTPTWKLVKVSANTSGTFFSTGRTRTHDLIITIGPKGDNSIQAHLASTIGNAVANANRSVFTTPCLQAGVC